ncbi:interaptin-like [Momordica charantia]|uniref:Interaptin-like n=1 Tax=Momordica charantia TaxID=3673 RepID=A0A6J1BW16_MOMCH|nr:interaptin-like [Momordica charantia]
MKKLFFFRSSAPSNSSTVVSSSRTEKEDCMEHPFEGAGLRRSRSLSSASFLDGGKDKSSSRLKDKNGSLSSNFIGISDQQCERSDRCQTPPFGRQCRAKQFETAHNTYGAVTERPSSAVSSQSYCDSSGNSSTSSSNVSTKILDRYIDDGEQQDESRRPQNNIPPRNYPESGSGRRPPRSRCTAPTSPKFVVDGEPTSHPSEEFPGSNYHFFSGKYAKNGLGHESPRTIAKNVIERLSQSHGIPKTSPKGFDKSIPITIGDIIHDRSSNGWYDSNLDAVPQKFCSVRQPSQAINRNNMECSGFDRQNIINHSELLNLVETEEDMDAELQRRTKEAEERVVLFREERDRESFLQQRTGVPGLIQTVRHITEEKISLALEVSSLLQSQITERVSAREELRLAKEKLDSQTKKLNKEKNELQSELEKELDRRSNEWSLKLEKYQFEERRLRERVRELAEQNVSLQREVSLFNERDTENRNIISNSEQKITDLTIMMDKLRDENQVLMQNVSELQDKYRTAKEDRESFKRHFEEKDKECKELYKSTTRLTRTCCDQQKTINGLQEIFTQELGKNQEIERFDKHVAKMQMEQLRLTGVELALRRELESCRFEIDSLRHENINIFNRLKDSGKDNGALTIKLDEEMLARVDCLQHKGQTLLNESSQLCADLLEFIKEKVHCRSESMQGMEGVKNNLDGLYLIESEVKVQGLKRGTESLKRSLQIVSSLLHKKFNLAASEVHSQCANADGSMQLNCDAAEHVLKSELKAERLLTCLLREKLFSKELEIEQLQAEIATAARANHILRCEVQNAQDNTSCISHKLKDLELQILKKDENVNRLQNDLEESTTELAIIRGTVPKISEERDIMWDQVKQYSEKNMLLNSEVNLLKKKIEVLEEDILLREGQITILKDTMRNKSFDLLGNIESTDEFLIR